MNPSNLNLCFIGSNSSPFILYNVIINFFISLGPIIQWDGSTEYIFFLFVCVLKHKYSEVKFWTDTLSSLIDIGLSL